MTALILAALFSILPENENSIVRTIAKEYKLTEEETALMCAIRRAENGTPPYYFGVANRKCNTFIKQARWTANTIRLRYDGSIEKFGARWCPTETKTWLKNVRFFMRKQGVKK